MNEIILTYDKMYNNNKLQLYGFTNPINTKAKIKLGGHLNMTTIRESAKEYEPTTTKNVCELKSVSTELDITEKTFQNKEGEDFTVSLITVDGEDYRVPQSVIGQVKVLLEDNPGLLTFKVKKSGEGMSTKYQVIPLE